MTATDKLFVLYKARGRLAFGELIHQRGDDLMVDEITPNTRHTAERVHTTVVKEADVLARGERYKMQDAADAGNWLLKPVSVDAVVAAAKKRLERIA